MTQFGPNFSVEDYPEMNIENFVTVLPYYEMDIPVQKGKNRVHIQYKTRFHLANLFRMPDEYKNTTTVLDLLGK